MTIDFNTAKAYAFHRRHGGYVVGHAAEYALRAARVELLLDDCRDANVASVDWNDDDEPYEYNPRGKGYEVADAEDARRRFDTNSWTGPFWASLTIDGEVVASLAGIVLDQRGANDPYCRVVEAELALEAEDELRQALNDRLDSWRDPDCPICRLLPYGACDYHADPSLL